LAGVETRTQELILSKSDVVVHCSGAADLRRTIAVSLDDLAVGRMAAQHLLDCNLQHFAFYGSPDPNNVAGLRLRGFRELMMSRNLPCHESSVRWPTRLDWLTHKHHPELIDWLKTLPMPIGVFAADDMAAHDLAAACLEAGIDVPDKVAIIGVNNDDLLCEGAWPSLSSINADFTRVGYHAAKLIDRVLSGETLAPEERAVRLPPLGVVQRMSTSILAVDEPEVVDAVRYIREHACDPCTVDQVLQHVPVGRRWLERKFNEKLGRSPHDEIIRVRMETAQRLLLQPDLSLPTIAVRCGFASQANLSRAFAQALGTTPAAYRRQMLARR
jgi:LacI family transcriptional regulator